jgi:hypothetical protein
MGRLGYDGEEGIYFDRTRLYSASMVDGNGDPVYLECDPVEVCEELEVQLAEAESAHAHYAANMESQLRARTATAAQRLEQLDEAERQRDALIGTIRLAHYWVQHSTFDNDGATHARRVLFNGLIAAAQDAPQSHTEEK